MHKINELQELTVLVLGTFLAIIGGIVREIADSEDAHKHAECYGVLSQMFVGGFSGLMAGLLLIEYRTSYTLVLVGCMMSGYWGVGAIVYIKKAILNKIK